MLSALSIQNYALIHDMKVEFGRGLIAITGETGAGKSILLGGLSMVLGKRADMSSLRDVSRKCIIEAEFDIEAYELRAFFEEHELEYHPKTWVRREIHPGGRSRAFINDTPVTLDILTALSGRLIDVHSQHATLEFTQQEVQMKVIDAVAENGAVLKKYKKELEAYRAESNELAGLLVQQSDANKELDYNQFLLQELSEAELQEGIKDQLEQQQQTLSNVEAILGDLGSGHQMLYDERMGLLMQLAELDQLASRFAGYGPDFQKLYERIQSVRIEMDDLAGEFEQLQSGLEVDPQQLSQVTEQLDALYALLKKHNAQDELELQEIRDDLASKVHDTSALEDRIQALQSGIAKRQKELTALADDLRSRRNRVIPQLEEKLKAQLADLGMPNASFEIALMPVTEFKSNGQDELEFRFSANKGSAPAALKKVASGGELSRIMLSIKSILAEYEPLPTLVFDEIDTGVSGEISHAMGSIMKRMSRHMQIFAITHLPQVASKGTYHFKVFKEDLEEQTRTQIKQLKEEERIVELAEMLGGKSLTDSALAHARQLLN